MERATRQHFFKHGKPGLDNEKKHCHWCQLRSFPTHRTAPVTIIGQDALPRNFRFINRMVYGKGVEAAEANFHSGCDCDAYGKGCQFSNCQCLCDLEEDETNKKAYAYHTHGAKAGTLRSKILDSKVPLYECHKTCSCSSSCPNRVVERGRTVPLQIFRTLKCGWGVCATEDVKKGQFVDCYFGEVITADEANRRRNESFISQKKDLYLFALDKFTDPDSLDPRLRGAPLEVDGEFMSGPTRFVNHSCEPNMKIFARVGDHADKHLHDLALFAIRDIPKGEELTFDYVAGGEEDEKEDVRHGSDNRERCLCGSKKCRKFLW